MSTEKNLSKKLLDIFKEKKYEEAENFAKLILKKYFKNQVSLKILSFISYNKKKLQRSFELQFETFKN